MDVPAARRLLYASKTQLDAIGGADHAPDHSTLRNALFGAGATLLAATAGAQINDRIRGAPSEANHFIETPRGWQHPKTAWGEPDIQAKLEHDAGGRRPARALRQQLPRRACRRALVRPTGPQAAVGRPLRRAT